MEAGKKSFLGGTQLSREMNSWPNTQFNKKVRVSMPSGAPAKNYRYEIVRADGARIQGVTDADGWAEVQSANALEKYSMRLLGPSKG